MNLLFYGVAAVIVISAFYVVRAHDLIHAVLWLAMTLLGTAALYGQLNEPFLAGVQVLTYIGGVVTLTIFGVMVTRKHEVSSAPTDNEGNFRGLMTAIAFFGVLALSVSNAQFPTTPAPPAMQTPELAHALLDQYLIPFELLSVLLLAAIVGAVVLARRKDPEPVEAKPLAREVTP